MKKPNIVFVMTDQQRRNSLGVYGCNYVHTPNLDQLASESTLYYHAYCNTPICTPSRASVMTGKTITGHGVYNLFDILPEGEKLLPSLLKEAGYQTALVGKLHVSGILYEKDTRNPNDGYDIYELCHEPSILLDSPFNGYAKWLKREFPEEYHRLEKDGRKVKNRSPESHFSTWVSERSAQIIRERDKNKPLFLTVGYFDPHSPYDHYPLESETLLHEEDYEEIIAEDEDFSSPEAIRISREIQCKNPHKRFTSEKIKKIRKGYFAAISFIDQQFKIILDTLKDEGIYNDTLIIFTSDHGDMIGDHNLTGKGAFLYDDCTNVPLIIKYPDQYTPKRNYGMVQLNDLFATMLHSAGIDDTISPESKALQHGTDRPCAITEYRGSGQLDLGAFPHPLMTTMVRTARYKLNIYHDSRELQLFDMIADPDELSDLSKNPEMQEVIIELMQLYMQECVKRDYQINSARGGRSEIPSFSSLWQHVKKEHNK
jgi:arylsulfatase